MARDWFTEMFAAGVADVRRELVEKAWFGAAEKAAPDTPIDRALHDKLYPDRSLDRQFLQSLEAEHARDQRAADAPQHDLER